jgi:hypothetical protein
MAVTPCHSCSKTNSRFIETFLSEVAWHALVGDGLRQLGAEQEELC